MALLSVNNPRRHAPVVNISAVSVRDTAPITPVVLMHGLGDAGSNPGMQSLATSIMAAYPGSYATAVDVANGLFSFIVPMQDQVDEFASTVKADQKLAAGFTAIGLSQGGLIIRAYVEQYAGRGGYPPVDQLISICGVQNGEYNCPLELQIIPFVCELFLADPYRLTALNLTSPLAFSDYFVTSMNQSMYLEQNSFLPALNNELPSRNANYTAAITSLKRIFLSEALNDTVVYPHQSESFGGYEWGSADTVYTFTDPAHSPQYDGNLLGLRDVYAAGRLAFSTFEGDHLRFSDAYWNGTILPLLTA